MRFHLFFCFQPFAPSCPSILLAYSVEFLRKFSRWVTWFFLWILLAVTYFALCSALPITTPLHSFPVLKCWILLFTLVPYSNSFTWLVVFLFLFYHLSEVSESSNMCDPPFLGGSLLEWFRLTKYYDIHIHIILYIYVYIMFICINNLKCNILTILNTFCV